MTGDRSGDDSPQRAGVVLAGGYSTRFGDVDKALAPVDGTQMIRRVVQHAGAVTDAVVVNCRADQRDRFASVLADCDVPLVFAIDPVDDAGPLSGLAGALAVHDAPVSVVVACDMPFVDPDFLAFLCERRDELGTEAVVPAPHGTVQPAQAVYATAPAAAAALDALGDGEASLRSLSDRLDSAVVDQATIAARDAGESLRDVNTPGSLSDR